MTAFAQVLAGAEQIEGGLAFEVPESWHQGRTAYGGFSSALALVAAQGVEENLPPLRSAQLAMIAPLAGRIEARAEILRRGRNATWVEVRISGDKGLGFSASFVFMQPVESALAFNERKPPANLVPAEEAPAVRFTSHTPAFLRNNFEARHALTPGGDRKPEMCRWVRAVGREGIDPMVELLLCADALPPGVMPMLDAAVPVSTMHWQVNLLTAAPSTQDGWWLLRSTGDYAHHGCSSQRMGLWNAAGEPMLAGMQSIALFG